MKTRNALICLLLALCLCLSLCACGTSDPVPDKDLEVRVMTLNGTTGFGMASLISESLAGKAALNYSFSVETDASNVTAALVNGDCDIAALPTNAFPNYSKSMTGSRSIKMLAVNTLGVLYLLSDDGTTVSPSDLSSLSGKTVYVPEQAPKLIGRVLGCLLAPKPASKASAPKPQQPQPPPAPAAPTK